MVVSPDSIKRLILAVIAYLMVFLAVPELTLRTSTAVDLLGTGSIRSGNLELDVKAVDIENYQRRWGVVDCLIIGASNAQSNLIPAEIQSSHHNCYNFSLGAVQSYEASTVLDILLAKYSIKLLIIGTTPSFFLPEPQPELYISNSHWVCCYNGRFDLAGFLGQHAASYQYYQLGLVRLLDPIHPHSPFRRSCVLSWMSAPGALSPMREVAYIRIPRSCSASTSGKQMAQQL
jgi:hypothetical protein